MMRAKIAIELQLYFNNGTFMAACNNDSGGIFHHNPDIGNFDDRYQIQYYTLEGLCDLDQTGLLYQVEC